MAGKPESGFIRSIHKYLPTVYFEKMANPYRGGTPDVWYSGHLGDLWVEYKFLPSLPRSKEIFPDLSPLQKLWLRRRYGDGRNVAVIVGCPEGAVVYEHLTWERGLTPTDFRARMVPRAEIARWITDTVGGASEHHPSSG
jgi:hypothetical protein